ncbi:hypothetical protein [Aquibacillus halophilus]|uniref:hypothetical protein n=1 Tax=Aquibacillus halophilus TaxID=930132 RepID=UPI0014797D68|nr:hypothetical protein [Aquibacillus halophilus]
MKQLEWQMVLFVGTFLAHDLWIYSGLPQLYYWDVKRDHFKKIKNKDDKNKIT